VGRKVGKSQRSPITYMLDGQQYITFFSGNNPGNRLYTFSLNGHEPMPDVPATKPETVSAKTAGSAPTERADNADGLPPGKGRELVRSRCVDCHGLELVVGQQATKEGWAAMVREMVSNGANLTDDEISTIVAHLADKFPPTATKH
jgi:mono/diheme cytochrome c family protein